MPHSLSPPRLCTCPSFLLVFSLVVVVDIVGPHIYLMRFASMSLDRGLRSMGPLPVLTTLKKMISLCPCNHQLPIAPQPEVGPCEPLLILGNCTLIGSQEPWALKLWPELKPVSSLITVCEHPRPLCNLARKGKVVHERHRAGRRPE